MNNLLSSHGIANKMGLIIWLASICLLVTCNKSGNQVSDPSDDNPPEPESNFNLMGFNVTCYNPSTGSEQGALVDIMIFDQSTGVRQFYGGTIPNGSFCTLGKLDRTKKYRIEVFDPANGKCISGAWDFTYGSHPQLWLEKCSDPKINLFGVGSCNDYHYLSNCWGG